MFIGAVISIFKQVRNAAVSVSLSIRHQPLGW
jgi:hypothetical protein